MNETEYIKFLERLYISKNDLPLYEKPKITRNLTGKTYKSATLFHPQSEIKFRRIDYLEGSDKNGDSEYECTLPGISINEFVFGIRSGLVYEHIKFKKDEVIQYFKLLENKNLIEELKSLQLETLNEERYVIVDSSLKKFLQQCWVLHGGVIVLYLFLKWRSIGQPTGEEEIWYKHLVGKHRSEIRIAECYRERKEFIKTKNKDLEQKILNQLNFQISGLRIKFESINKEYTNIIKKYSYFVEPLLNLVFPEFLRIK